MPSAWRSPSNLHSAVKNSRSRITPRWPPCRQRTAPRYWPERPATVSPPARSRLSPAKRRTASALRHPDALNLYRRWYGFLMVARPCPAGAWKNQHHEQRPHATGYGRPHPVCRRAPLGQRSTCLREKVSALTLACAPSMPRFAVALDLGGDPLCLDARDDARQVFAR